MTATFRESAIAELGRKCPNIMTMSENMSNTNPNKASHYNPEHPAAIDNLKNHIHPAGELMKLAVQVALTGITSMSELPVPSEDEWKELGAKCKKISSVAKRVGRDILTMGQKWELGDFIAERCQSVLEDGPAESGGYVTADMLDEDEDEIEMSEDWDEDEYVEDLIEE